MSHAIVTLTEGNIRNHHLYLSEVWDLIPPDAVGGSNESEAAAQQLEVNFGVGAPIVTDIAGDKKIFRKRTWVREFFEAHGLVAGSRVVVEKTGSHRFHVYPARTLIAKAI
jgi:hypothetical protein